MQKIELVLADGRMNAIDAGISACPEKFSHSFIGGYHEFLDQPVHVMPVCASEICNTSPFVKTCFRLRQIKVQGSPSVPGICQDVIEFQGLPKHGNNLA